MVAIYRIAFIAIILMVTSVQCSFIKSYLNVGKVSCYPSPQWYLLEAVHPYIHCLSCSPEGYHLNDGGFVYDIWRVIMRGRRIILQSQEDVYVCDLNWKIISVSFSVNTHWCVNGGGVQNLWTMNYYYINWLLLPTVALWLIMLWYYCCSGYSKYSSNNKDGRKCCRQRFKHRLPIMRYSMGHSHTPLKKTYETKAISKRISDVKAGHTKKSLNWVRKRDIKHVTKFGDYTVLRILGWGSFAKIYLAKSTDRLNLSKKLPPVSGKEDFVAMKVVDKQILSKHRGSQSWTQAAVNELRIMQMSECCPFLMYILSGFQTYDYLVHVMPLMFGTLFNYKSAVSTRKLVLVAAEMIHGLTHLHSLGFIHRDLKMDNVLIDEQGHLKISDFGCSQGNVYGRKKCYGIVGNRRYQAPEVLQGRPYHETCDFWSLGVIMYILIEKTYPFQDIMKKTKTHLLFQRASEEERQFIQDLFHHNPDQRLGSQHSQLGDVYAHSYFSGIDHSKVWDGLYEAPCPGMVSPLESLERYESKFRGIPVTPDFSVDAEDLVIYQDFPVVSII